MLGRRVWVDGVTARIRTLLSDLVWYTGALLVLAGLVLWWWSTIIDHPAEGVTRGH